MIRLGLISDTHGSLPSRVSELFAEVDHIVHAGDYGSPEILWELESMAPLTFVRGNTDPFGEGEIREEFEIGGCRLVVAHESHDLRVPSLPPDTCVAITGHTHVPRILTKGRVLHINPGSPVRPREGHRPSVALVSIADGVPEAKIVYL